MSGYEPSSNFQDAAAYLSSASSLSQVSSSIKLELYGLFKYLNVSRTPTVSRPSIFDMTGRAKWDAWATAGKKYEHWQEVEKRYLEIAMSLGWTKETKVESTRKSTASQGDEDIWDEEDDQPKRSGGGLGVAVSSMAATPAEPTDTTIHGLVLANDVTGLTKILDEHPESDLNALDEFGYAPIHLACDRGNIEAVKLLLNRGADRNVKDPDDLTPLELSQEAGHEEIEKLLTSSL